MILIPDHEPLREDIDECFVCAKDIWDTEHGHTAIAGILDGKNPDVIWRVHNSCKEGLDMEKLGELAKDIVHSEAERRSAVLRLPYEFD